MIPREANHPNKASRMHLKVFWENMNDDDREKLRANRAQRGMTCDFCGAVGFFREICPNACSEKYQTPPPTPDSDDEREARRRKKKGLPPKVIHCIVHLCNSICNS